MTSDTPEIRPALSVSDCRWCRASHDVEFRRLEEPIDDEWTHLGSCPSTGEYIFMVPARREDTGERVHILCFPQTLREA